jgi:hypothetical protein
MPQAANLAFRPGPGASSIEAKFPGATYWNAISSSPSVCVAGSRAPLRTCIFSERPKA